MPEAQRARVEALAVLAQLLLFVAVDHISQDGVADVGHVDADLVGPSRLQLAADVGVAPVALDDPQWVTAWRELRSVTHIFLRSLGCRPMGASTVPLSSRKEPTTMHS